MGKMGCETCLGELKNETASDENELLGAEPWQRQRLLRPLFHRPMHRLIHHMTALRVICVVAAVTLRRFSWISRI